MEEYFGTKELYSVVLKSTYDIGQIKEGDILASFDNIQIGGLDQLKDFRTARGGYGNAGLVSWETTKEINFSFSQGVFSKEQLQWLINSKIVQTSSDEVIIFKEEKKEVQDSKIILSRIPYNGIVRLSWVEDEDFKKVEKTGITTTTVSVAEISNGTEVLVRYDFKYTGSYELFKIGENLTNGFLSLEGHMRLKDDLTGNNVTGILKIPKIKLMSGLSMRLGRNANPFVADFKGVGYPVGSRGSQSVCELFILPEDIDSDI